MKLETTPLPCVLVVEPKLFRDERGFFLEVFHAGKFAAQGLDVAFVQDNHSLSRRGTLRGLHVQLPKSQGKLVRCTEGAVFDVAVDIRQGSPAFGRWFGIFVASLNAISALLSIPAYPLWSLAVFALAIIIVYKLAEGPRTGSTA